MTGIAIVGTGMWGPRLAAAVERAGLELVTCFRRDEGKRREFADRHGCESAASMDEAIAHPGVEGVVLATPNDVHEEQTLACAERGRHVFVEKPIAESIEAGERMRSACAEAGVALMVGHAFRRLGAARRVKRLLSLRLLGTEAVLDYHTDFSVWPDTQALDGVVTKLTLAGEPVEFDERDMLAEEFAEFGRCIRGQAEPETGANEGIAALAAVLQALEMDAEAVR
jgi:predicted dehydrogenase